VTVNESQRRNDVVSVNFVISERECLELVFEALLAVALHRKLSGKSFLTPVGQQSSGLSLDPPLFSVINVKKTVVYTQVNGK